MINYIKDPKFTWKLYFWHCVIFLSQIWHSIINFSSNVTSTRLIREISVKLNFHVSMLSPILTGYMVTFVFLHINPVNWLFWQKQLVYRISYYRGVKTQIWPYNRLIWTIIWRHEKLILPELPLLVGSMSHLTTN